MPAPIVNSVANVQCSHTGRATPTQPALRVRVDDSALIQIQSQYFVAGCSLSGTSTPPCATGAFVRGATRVTSDGVAIVLAIPNTSVCIPTGTPMLVLACQTRVVAE